MTELTRAATDSVTVTGEYMGGTAVLAIFGAVTQLVIMVILGIPLAFPLAILTFFGGFIPIVGSFITTGIAFLVAFWFISRLRSPWRWLILAYPLAMSLALTYFAEHYVFDVFMGWAYALAAVVVVGRILAPRSSTAALRVDAVPEEVRET